MPRARSLVEALLQQVPPPLHERDGTLAERGILPRQQEQEPLPVRRGVVELVAPVGAENIRKLEQRDRGR